MGQAPGSIWRSPGASGIAKITAPRKGASRRREVKVMKRYADSFTTIDTPPNPHGVFIVCDSASQYLAK
jgi:hypothetical protein